MIRHAVSCFLVFCWPVHGHHHRPHAHHARHHHAVIVKKMIVEKKTVVIVKQPAKRSDVPLNEPVPW